ncbi:hypothetical protein [Anaeromyxobacter oryzae]|uniref:Uncharacterized protein n=1 Tax=Anaeromyxobacter oryzae TaxID=2918170 RepID=A0ABM7X475_9BACT|nr:hypothetical protein [Anaeromyxobacter oryzae]BDG06614.1 hypothetical protein AMOR_56100 [Anaeromyxobacter oryzae]
MPAKALTESRKSIYLDWSTFVDAFRGIDAPANDPARALHDLVVRLSAGENLCFSLTHVWELLHQENPASRVAIARWLDRLDLVWVYSDNDVIKREVLHAVLDAVRGTKTPAPLPAAASFFSLFEAWDAESLGYALAHPTLADFVDVAGSAPSLMARLARFRELSVQSARRLYDDRITGLQQVDRAAMEEELDRKVRANLQVDVAEAAALLRKDPASGFHRNQSGIFVAPTDAEVAAAVNGFPDLTVLPFIFLFHRALRAMSFEIIARPSTASRAFEQQRGDLYDLTHLVGAAYADVFTCDTRTARRLDNGRDLLGRPPPITAVGGPAAVAQHIEAQVAR